MKKTVFALLALAALASCGKQAEPLSEQVVHSQMSRCGDATYLDYTGTTPRGWSSAPSSTSMKPTATRPSTISYINGMTGS